jgi:hypothetical protein
MAKKIKLSDFKQDADNFNEHTEEGLDLLHKSIKTAGVIESITVADNGEIISGNARHEKIKEVLGDKEPIVVEIDGKTPVVLKRVDIKGGSKEFYEAALLANTVSVHNINLNGKKIAEVAERTGLDAKELGYVKVEGTLKRTFEGNGDEFDETALPFPVTVLLSEEEYNEWRKVKEEIKEDNDAKAFRKILKDQYL